MHVEEHQLRDCDVYKGKREFPCQTFTRCQVVKLVERPVPNVETQGSGVRILRGSNMNSMDAGGTALLTGYSVIIDAECDKSQS